MRFRRLLNRYRWGMLIAGVFILGFYAGRTTATRRWTDLVPIGVWIFNGLLLGWPLWQDHKKDREELKAMMRAVETEMARRREEEL